MELFLRAILKYFEKMIIKIQPDKEKAKSMLGLISNRSD